MKLTTATEQRIPLNLLIEWENNPRKSRDENDVVQMAASLSSIGQQYPLLVHKTDDEKLYKVIEGETRRRGFNLNATNDVIAPDAEIRCWVLPTGATEEQLLAVAVTMNTVRRQMNPIEEMEAFHSLAKSGVKLSDIAEMFAVDLRTIRQRLALGDLIEAARDLVRDGSRKMGWAQAMTLGSPAAQERIVNEIISNPSAYPDGASVRAELTRGHIPVSSALFDASELADCLVCDLFNQEGDYFSDTAKFWERQGVEIQKLIDSLQETHAAVKFVDRTRFDEAGWTEGGEPSESTAVVIAHDDGTVEVREGMIPPVVEEDDDDEGNFLVGAEDFYSDDADVSGEDSGAPVSINSEGDGDAPATIAKVEVNPLDNATKDTMSYLTAQASAALRVIVASDPRLSMAFVVASTLTRRGPASTMQIAGLNLDPREQTTQVFAQLQAKRAARDRIATDAGVAGVTSPAQVISKLLTLEEGLLEQLFAYTVAESIAVGIDEETMNIFDAVGAEVMTGWQIEQNYLDTLNNAQVRALATEVVDLADQPSPRASRSIVEKAILESVDAAALSGNFASNDLSWIPPQIADAVNKAAAKRAAATASERDDVAQAA